MHGLQRPGINLEEEKEQNILSRYAVGVAWKKSPALGDSLTQIFSSQGDTKNISSSLNRSDEKTDEITKQIAQMHFAHAPTPAPSPSSETILPPRQMKNKIENLQRSYSVLTLSPNAPAWIPQSDSILIDNVNPTMEISLPDPGTTCPQPSPIKRHSFSSQSHSITSVSTLNTIHSFNNNLRKTLGSAADPLFPMNVTPNETTAFSAYSFHTDTVVGTEIHRSFTDIFSDSLNRSSSVIQSKPNGFHEHIRSQSISLPPFPESSKYDAHSSRKSTCSKSISNYQKLLKHSHTHKHETGSHSHSHNHNYNHNHNAKASDTLHPENHSTIPNEDDAAFTNDLSHIIVWFNNDLTANQRALACQSLFQFLTIDQLIPLRSQISRFISKMKFDQKINSSRLGQQLNQPPHNHNYLSNGQLTAFQDDYHSNPFPRTIKQSVPLNMPAPIKSPFLGAISTGEWSLFQQNSPPQRRASQSSYDSSSSSPGKFNIMTNTDASIYAFHPQGQSYAPAQSYTPSTQPLANEFLFKSDLFEWLRFHRLHKYHNVFSTLISLGLTRAEIVKLDDLALQNYGITALGARRKFLKLFELLKDELYP